MSNLLFAWVWFGVGGFCLCTVPLSVYWETDSRAKSIIAFLAVVVLFLDGYIFIRDSIW